MKKKIAAVVIALALVAGGGIVSYNKFFKYYFAGLSDVCTEDENSRIEWTWQEDNGEDYKNYESFGVYIITPDEGYITVHDGDETYTRKCSIEYTDSPFSHKIEFKETDLDSGETGRVLLSGTYRCTSAERLVICVDDEYVGKNTNDNDKLEFEKVLESPLYY